jgi:anti-sigma factor RsiW
MTCAHARRLFGAFWDDETTQAERETLEGHFAGCERCRAEYDSMARALEAVASLPREEAAPDFTERVLARARRASPAPDRVGAPARSWVPLTAAASLLVIAAAMVAPWIGLALRPDATPTAIVEPVRQPELIAGVEPTSVPPASVKSPDASNVPATETLASIPDSIFDHSADVEFILDPVAVRRGRATITRVTEGVQAEQAVISF